MTRIPLEYLLLPLWEPMNSEQYVSAKRFRSFFKRCKLPPVMETVPSPSTDFWSWRSPKGGGSDSWCNIFRMVGKFDEASIVLVLRSLFSSAGPLQLWAHVMFFLSARLWWMTAPFGLSEKEWPPQHYIWSPLGSFSGLSLQLNRATCFPAVVQRIVH